MKCEVDYAVETLSESLAIKYELDNQVLLEKCILQEHGLTKKPLNSQNKEDIHPTDFNNVESYFGLDFGSETLTRNMTNSLEARTSGQTKGIEYSILIMNDWVNLNMTSLQPKLDSPLSNNFHHPNEFLVSIINDALGNLGVVILVDSLNGLRAILNNQTLESPIRNSISVDGNFPSHDK